MKRLLQSVLLRCYQVALASGLLATKRGRRGFEWAYEVYKATLEAGDLRALETIVTPGTTVVDVGANIGFFTRRFARWVGEGGRVIAIEPEVENCSRLRSRLASARLGRVVEVIEAVAAEQGGSLKLAINPLHPADHRIAREGVTVAAVTLDALLAARSWPRVSLIKVDVQGAEERVLAGATETLQRLHPPLFLEVDDAALKAMDSSAEKLLQRLAAQGYTIRRLERGHVSPPVTIAEALPSCCNGRYTDFLFLHSRAPGRWELRSVDELQPPRAEPRHPQQ